MKSMGNNKGPSTPAIASQSPVKLTLMRAESDFRRDTRHLPREEQERYGSMVMNLIRFESGPKVFLTELVGPGQDRDVKMADEERLSRILAYYANKANKGEMLNVVKYLAAYYLQQARKEVSYAQQFYLLFRAVDLCRMIVQYSTYAMNADAEALVLGVFVDLSAADTGFDHAANCQRVVYDLMKKLQVSPSEISLRLKLADSLVEQGSYMDALVQLMTALKIYRPGPKGNDKVHGVIFAKTGDVLNKVAEVTPERLKDGRKLKNFVSRYNWEYAEKGRELPDPQRLNSQSLNVLRSILLGEVTQWYVRGTDVPALDRLARLTLVKKAAQIYMEINKMPAALHLLEQGYHLWHKVPFSQGVMEEQAEYLNMLVQTATRTNKRDSIGWAGQELSRLREELGVMHKEAKQKEAFRKALLEGDE